MALYLNYQGFHAIEGSMRPMGPEGPPRAPWGAPGGDPWGGALRAPGRRQTRSGKRRGFHGRRLPGPCVRSTLRTFFLWKFVFFLVFSFFFTPGWALGPPWRGPGGGAPLARYKRLFLFWRHSSHQVLDTGRPPSV